MYFATERFLSRFRNEEVLGPYESTGVSLGDLCPVGINLQHSCMSVIFRHDKVVLTFQERVDCPPARDAEGGSINYDRPAGILSSPWNLQPGRCGQTCWACWACWQHPHPKVTGHNE